MKNANAESCASTSLSVKMPFTAATNGSIREVMKPQAKNSVVTATKAARTVGLLIRFSPAASDRDRRSLPSGGRLANRHIVDQPCPADPRSDKQTGRPVARRCHGLQALGVSQLGVIDARKACCEETAFQGFERLRDIIAVGDPTD